MLWFCQFTTQSSCYNICKARVALKCSRFSSGKASWRYGQQSPGRGCPKSSVMREDPFWDLPVLVLFLFIDFLGKLPSYANRVRSYLRTDTSVTFSHCSSCPKEQEFPSPLPMTGLQEIVWPQMPTPPHPCLYRSILFHPHLPPGTSAPVSGSLWLFFLLSPINPPLKCSLMAFLDFSLLLISKQIPANVSYSYEMCVLINRYVYYKCKIKTTSTASVRIHSKNICFSKKCVLQ